MCSIRVLKILKSVGVQLRLLLIYRSGGDSLLIMQTLLCDMLEFGFPLDIQGVVPVTTDFRAHKGARDYPAHVDQYLQTETGLGRMAGPFADEPLSVPLHVSPINSVPKDNADERRIIADLSWPHGG